MKVLLIVDVQRDFCPGGSLAVSDGDRIIPTINKLSASGEFDLVIATKDYHPEGHISFASTHGLEPFSELNGDTVWPDHCVDGTTGVEFNEKLETENINHVILKGTSKDMDSYSAFLENDKVTKTGMCDLLEPHKAKLTEDECLEIFVVGIATDVCVKHTALDARVLNFEGTTSVIVDACAGVSEEGVNLAVQEMAKEGIAIRLSEEFI